MTKLGTKPYSANNATSYESLMKRAVPLVRDPVALAVFTYLQTKHAVTPDGCRYVRREDVMKWLGIGKDRYYKAINYLRDLELVYKETVRDRATGQVLDNRLVVLVPGEGVPS